jgi:hypothetical protein
MKQDSGSPCFIEGVFSREVSDSLSLSRLLLHYPQVFDLVCPKRAISLCGLEKEEDEWKLRYKCKLAGSRRFSVDSEAVVLSDDANFLTCIVDAVVRYGGASSIVKIYRRGGDRHLEDVDMVLSMYLSGIWDGIRIEVGDDGKVSCQSASITERKAVSVLEMLFAASREMKERKLSGAPASARPGRHCPCCPVRKGCVEYGVCEADSERRDQTRYQPEAGGQPGPEISGDR